MLLDLLARELAGLRQTRDTGQQHTKVDANRRRHRDSRLICVQMDESLDCWPAKGETQLISRVFVLAARTSRIGLGPARPTTQIGPELAHGREQAPLDPDSGSVALHAK